MSDAAPVAAPVPVVPEAPQTVTVALDAAGLAVLVGALMKHEASKVEADVKAGPSAILADVKAIPGSVAAFAKATNWPVTIALLLGGAALLLHFPAVIHALF